MIRTAAEHAQYRMDRVATLIAMARKAEIEAYGMARTPHRRNLIRFVKWARTVKP